MIKANELRIGNLVFDSTGNVTKVESIAPLQKRVRKGIPLTEERLVEFGFKEQPSNHLDSGKRVFINKPLLCVTSHIKLGNNPWVHNYFFMIADPQGATNSYKKEYVHQLQNLYFALTGEELTLKEGGMK